MSTLDLANRVIDLRTVMESLYCAGGQGALRFRSSLLASLHLAPSLKSRKQYYNDFSKLYGFASDVVHGKLKPGQKADLDRLLPWGSNELRKAILKRLDERSDRNWLDLMLGLDDD